MGVSLPTFPPIGLFVFTELKDFLIVMDTKFLTLHMTCKYFLVLCVIFIILRMLLKMINYSF